MRTKKKVFFLGDKSMRDGRKKGILNSNGESVEVFVIKEDFLVFSAAHL